jgi:hypothetical protein
MRPTNSYEPLHGDGKGHVGGGAEVHRWHGVEDVHIHMGEERGCWEPMIYRAYSSICMDWYIEYDVPMKRSSIGMVVYTINFTHRRSYPARAARSWLNVCFLMSLEWRVMMEVKLEISPHIPRELNRILSHQNSYSFHT